MSEWTLFSDRLPSADDASGTSLVLLRGENGSTRSGLWNWISPHHPDAASLWAVNGFFAWRRMRADDPIYRPLKEPT